MHSFLRRGAEGDVTQCEVLERRQRAAVERSGKSGASRVGDLGVVEVEAPELLQPSSRRRHEGSEALVAPPPPAGTLPLPPGGLKRLRFLYFENTHVTDAGCAALAAALDSGALPALIDLNLDGTPASDAAKAAVQARLPMSMYHLHT